MDKLKAYFDTARYWVADHKKASLVIACVIVGFVWGAWSRGLFAAPLTCDYTNNALTCQIPGSGTTVPPVITPPPPVSEFSGCPAGTTIIRSGFPYNGNGAPGSNGSVLTIKLAIPADARLGGHQAFFGSTYGGSATRTFVISATPCDFAAPVNDSTGKRPKPLSIVQTTNNAVTLGFPVTDDDKGLKRGQTYYLNVRIDGGCAGSCSFDAIRIN